MLNRLVGVSVVNIPSRLMLGLQTDEGIYWFDPLTGEQRGVCDKREFEVIENVNGVVMLRLVQTSEARDAH